MFSFGSLLKSFMKTTPRLMALVLVVQVVDLVRLRIPKIEVQMNPYIPHNPLQGSYGTPHGLLKLAIFIAKM